ncbi:MAG: hypothetical protein H7Y38_19595 [Armatimonadetes bacterium]|nr:hypothetical protein [Armatimonadota bacterium]
MVAGVDGVAGNADDAPLPVLMQARLDAARAREKQIPVFRWGWEKTPPLPPVPPAAPQNPWRRIAGNVPADATKLRTYKPVIYAPNTIVGGRSRFRKGEVVFDANGLTFSGVGVKPVGWLKKAGCAAYIVLGFLFAVDKLFLPQGYIWGTLLRWLVVASVVIAVLAHTMENVITEWRRGEKTLVVPWSDCLETQWERGLRWAVIIFRSYESDKPGGTATIAHLPLNGLSPAQGAMLWDAFDGHAPGRNRVNDVITETDPRFLVFLSTLLGVLCFLLTIVVTILIRRQLRP